MIVQRIVQEHGGQIEIASKPGEGTNFTILLPLAERRVRLLKAPREKKSLAEGQGREHGSSPKEAGNTDSADEKSGTEEHEQSE